MPDYFTHAICADVIYKKLESKYKNMILSKDLYFLGAQGGDVFFTYNMKPSKANLGRIMHKMSPVALFEKLAEGNLSYLAGFATHYALDACLHPEIYSYERTSRSPFAHVKFEDDLGLFVSRKEGARRQIAPKEKVLACTYSVYDSVKRIEDDVTVTGIERCLKRHFSYSKFKYRLKKQNYKCRYDFSILSESVDESINFGIKCVKCALDKDIDPEVFSRSFLQR